MRDAQHDHLMMRIESFRTGLLLRADQLDNEADTAQAMNAFTAPGRTPEILRIIAVEFRRMAATIE